MQYVNNVGIDVGSKTLVICVQHARTGEFSEGSFENNSSGHKKLLKYITKRGSKARVCMEATGVYHFNLAVLLHKSDDVEVMVANPRAINNFSKALMKRSKTDKIDAEIILKYLMACDFNPWQPPEENCLILQKLSRRMYQLSVEIRREQSRLHADENMDSLTKLINKDINDHIKQLKKRFEKLESTALKHIKSDEKLNHVFDIVISPKGIGERSAIALMGEIVCMPEDMTGSQWVAYAGLDPRAVESGESINKPRRISKAGNKYLRGSLYMPSWVAVQNDPHVRAYYIKLRERGTIKMKAITAVSRKLLTCLWGMLHNDELWQPEKFHEGKVPKSTPLPE